MDDLELAVLLADAADAISMDRFQAVDLQVEAKPDLSLVSDADRAVEQELRRLLAEHRPDDAVSGEEYGSEGTGSRRWVLDPIDGTHGFVRGTPVWGTLIGLMDGSEVVAGMVSAPALGRRWWAARGAGAWGSVFGGAPRRLAVSSVSSLADASFCYASLGGWGPRRDALLRLLDGVWRTRAYGDFWSYMLVAEGVVDAAAEPELSLWDLAALVPIVVEAGGRFTSLEGIDGPHGPSAVGSNGVLHDAVLAALDPDGSGQQ